MRQSDELAHQDFQPALGNPEVNAAFAAVTIAVNTFIELSTISPDGVMPMIEDALYKQLSEIVTQANRSVDPSMFSFSSPASEPIIDLYIQNAKISQLIICAANEAFRQCTASYSERSKNTEKYKSQISKLESFLIGSKERVLSLATQLDQSESDRKSNLLLLEEQQNKYKTAIQVEKKTADELRKKLNSIQANFKSNLTGMRGKQTKAESQQPTQKMLDDLRAQIKTLKKTHDSQLSALEEQVRNFKTESAALKAQNEAFRNQLAASAQAHEKAAAAATQTLAEKDAQIAALQAELSQAREERSEASEQLAKQRKTFSAHLNNQATKDEKIQALQLVIPNLQQANADLAAQYHQLQTAHFPLQEAYAQLVEQCKQLERANVGLAAQMQQMHAYIGALHQQLYQQPVPPSGHPANFVGLFREAGAPAGRGNAQAGQHVPTQHGKR